MIQRSVLKVLADKRYKDSDKLLHHRRYQGSIYLGGYVIELLLKYNICMLFKLTKGYPETMSEYIRYSGQKSGFSVAFSDINDLKTHNLQKLIKYSGREIDIKANAISEWNNITSKIHWKPELRYENSKFKKNDAHLFLVSISTLKSILLT